MRQNMSWIDNPRYKYKISIFVSFVALAYAISHFALSLWLDLVLAAIIVFYTRRAIPSLIFSGLIVGLALLVSAVWQDRRFSDIYFRPHERYRLQEDIYMSNVKSRFEMPFGDLVILGGDLSNDVLDKLKEPRVVRFETDKLGYRNDAALHDARIILAGDSFIVGNGTTQKEMLSAALSRKLGKAVYNVAFPGKPRQYEERLLSLTDAFPKDAGIYVFYFEGNDFSRKKEQRGLFSIIVAAFGSAYASLEDWKSRYLEAFYPKEQVFFRIIRRRSHQFNAAALAFFTRLLARNASAQDKAETQKVSVKTVNGKVMGFYKEYNEMTLSDEVSAYVFKNKRLLEKIRAVLFIPTKLRVYSENLKNSPSAALKSLISGYAPLGVEVLDLTPVLRTKAESSYSERKFVFWRDDTHWNGTGISAVAEFIAQYESARR